MIKKSEDNNSYTISSYFFLSPKEDYSQRKKDLGESLTLGHNFKVNPKFPEVCFITSDKDLKIHSAELGYSYSPSITNESSYFDVTDLYYLPSGSELVFNNHLLSKRKSTPYECTISTGLHEEKITPISLRQTIKYDSINLYLLDQYGDLSLYTDTDIEEDAAGANLYLFNKSKMLMHIFQPFISYSLGNGIAYLENAYILNDYEILCVAGQAGHVIYNCNNQKRTQFELGMRVGREAHIFQYLSQTYLSKDKLKLYTITYGGLLSVFDIKTGKLLMEIDIPKLHIGNNNNLVVNNLSFASM